MTTATIAGKEITLDDEGFMTEYDEWSEALGEVLASQIGIEMTDAHWEEIGRAHV